jgi:hypothetical protein
MWARVGHVGFGGQMREEIRQEIQRKISESFEKARSVEAPARKKISEEQRLAQQQTYIELLYRAAVKQLG